MKEGYERSWKVFPYHQLREAFVDWFWDLRIRLGHDISIHYYYVNYISISKSKINFRVPCKQRRKHKRFNWKIFLWDRFWHCGKALSTLQNWFWNVQLQSRRIFKTCKKILIYRVLVSCRYEADAAPPPRAWPSPWPSPGSSPSPRPHLAPAPRCSESEPRCRAASCWEISSLCSPGDQSSPDVLKVIH